MIAGCVQSVHLLQLQTSSFNAVQIPMKVANMQMNIDWYRHEKLALHELARGISDVIQINSQCSAAASAENRLAVCNLLSLSRA